MWFDTLLSPSLFLFSPEKRIYWGYLLISLLIAVMVSGKQWFNVKLWFNQSSLIDVLLLFVNQWLYKLLVVPLFALQISYAFSLSQTLSTWFGQGDWITVSPMTVTILFTVALFVIQDFFKFLIHKLLHTLPFLWRFHKVHHSATTLTPLTLYRLHPFEMFINAARSFIISVFITGLFLYLFKNQLSLLQILGVNAFVFTFNIAASNLRHSPIKVGFGVLENVFISPAQHQIHHSAAKQHYDKNFGSALAIWDKWFGSLLLSKEQTVTQFGLSPIKVNAEKMPLTDNEIAN